MTTVADFHSTRYTSWCPERKDIDQWASTVAEGGAPKDCRFQPLTLLPEDHEDAEACNEYDYAACAEEDLDAYLESLPKSNRWTELEASCAWLDQANIRIEELDLTHGLPEHLVLNQPRAEHAPDTHHPRAPAGAAAAAAAATAAFPLPPAVPSASAAAAATAGDLPHKLSSHSSFSGVSTNTQQHKQHPTLRFLSSSLLTHLGFSPRPHSSPRSSPSPSASASPIKTRQNPRRQSKEFALRAKSQQQIHHFQHPSAPLPIPHHHASSSPGVPHGPFHQSSSSPGVPLGPLHHSSSSPGMTVGPLYQSSSPKLPLAPINHTSSSPGLNISQASFHHSSSSPGMLIHPSAVPLTRFIVPENSGVQYQPGVLYSNIDGADMGGSSGIYSAKFNDAEEEITGVEIIGASNTVLGGGNPTPAGTAGYSSRHPNFGGSARFIAPKMVMQEQLQQQHPRQHMPRQHQALATPGRDISSRVMSSVDSRTAGTGRTFKASTLFLPEFSPGASEWHLVAPLEEASSEASSNMIAHKSSNSISSDSSKGSCGSSSNENNSSKNSSSRSGGGSKKSGLHKFWASLLDVDTHTKGRGRKIKVWMGDAPRANVGVSA